MKIKKGEPMGQRNFITTISCISLLISICFFSDRVLAEKALYDSFVEKVVEMAQPPGKKATESEMQNAKDAGRIFLGDNTAGNDAHDSIVQRTLGSNESRSSSSSIGAGSSQLALNGDSSASFTPQQGNLADTIKMKNGDSFNGRVQIEEVTLNTPYGMVSFPRSMLQRITMTGKQKNVETLITLGGDRFSGFLVNADFPINLAAGNQIKVRKEKIDEIVLASQSKTGAMAATDAIEMRNTDAFHAEVVTPEFTIDTSYGVLSFKREKIEFIEFEGDERVIGKITLRNGEGSFQGTLKNEEIIVRTRSGQELGIYKDKYKKIGFGNPASHQTAGQEAAVVFGGEALGQAGSGQPVTGNYVLVMRKGGRGSIAYSVTVAVNDQTIGVFTGERVVPIEKHLRTGMNQVRVSLEPLPGMSGDNYLTLKMGPSTGNAFSPELYFSTSIARDNKKHQLVLPYYVADSGKTMQTGQIALFVTPDHFEKNMPLTSSVYIDDRFICKITGPITGLPLPNLDPASVHRLKLLTSAVPNVRGSNGFRIEVARIAGQKNSRYQYASLLEVSNKHGWRENDGYMIPEDGNQPVTIEMPFSL